MRKKFDGSHHMTQLPNPTSPPASQPHSLHIYTAIAAASVLLITHKTPAFPPFKSIFLKYKIGAVGDPASWSHPSALCLIYRQQTLFALLSQLQCINFCFIVNLEFLPRLIANTFTVWVWLKTKERLWFASQYDQDRRQIWHSSITGGH